MGPDFRLQLRGFARLLWHNLKHYSLAIWGIRLRLDPDYPIEARFRGELVTDSVLEYRAYGLFAPWSIVLALVLPPAVLPLLGFTWAFLATMRAGFYASGFRFWRRAYQESPAKMRVRTRYVEALIYEIERRMKAGEPTEYLVNVCMNIQNGIIERKK